MSAWAREGRWIALRLLLISVGGIAVLARNCH